MKLLLFLLIPCVVSFITPRNGCFFNGEKMSAKWKMSNATLFIEFVGEVKDGQWASIGVGPSMKNLEVLVFMVSEGQPKLVTGTTSGYETPKLHKKPVFTIHSMKYSKGTISATVTRKVNAQLANCNRWSFVADGVVNKGEISPPHGYPGLMNVSLSNCIGSWD